jgi:N-methylhydantoinase B
MIDPFLVSIIGKKLESISRDIFLVLERTARSPLFQVRDFSTGLLDTEHRILCQEEGLPLMTYGFSAMLDHLVRVMDGDIGPGDIFIQNDPFHGNNQVQDTAIFKPVFFDGSLRFWAASKGHLADWGSAVLGNYNQNATDIWQEAMRLPPLKIYDAGRFRRDVWALLMANTRLPDLVAGDIQAMIGACRVADNRLLELRARYDEASLLEHIEALLDSSHKRMQHEIRQIPEGVYRSEATWRLPAGLEREEMVCRLTVTIEGGHAELDFTGTDPQSSHYYNGVYGTTYAAAISTFLMLVDPDIPHNEGVERCIEITIPEGTFLNAAFPGPSVMGNFVANDVVGEVVMKAMTSAAPDRVCAGWARGLQSNFSGVRPNGKPFYHIPLMSNKGGGGAVEGVDGWSCIGLITCAGGFAFDDYEVFETSLPVRLIEHEYREESAGAGRWRGGFGIRLKYRIDPPASMTTFGDGTDQPYGLFGGRPGAPNDFIVTRPDGSRATVPPNVTLALDPGSIVEAHNGGGGGYGSPLERAVDLVRADVRNELISRETAENVYGVYLSGPPLDEVDEARTSAARVDGTRGDHSTE